MADKDFRGGTGKKTEQAAWRTAKVHRMAVDRKCHCYRGARQSWRGGTVTERGTARHLCKPGIRLNGGHTSRMGGSHSENMFCCGDAGGGRLQQGLGIRAGEGNRPDAGLKKQAVRGIGGQSVCR